MGALGFKDGSKKAKAAELLLRGATKEEILKVSGLSKNTLMRLLNQLKHRSDLSLTRKTVYYVERQ